MYTQHFRLTEQPFSIAPNPRYLYLSPQHREALAHLLYGIGVGGGFVVLTGEVGTGKTTLCRALLDQLPEDVDIALIFNPRLNSRELLAGICDELHIPYVGPKASLKQLIDALNQYLLASHARGRRVIVLIDEAQNLRFDVLEQVRLLTNLETNQTKLLQIILVGQPELNQILDRPNLRQLSQRITARYHLNPLSLTETRDYIRHRMTVASGSEEVFTRTAIRAIHHKARGIPRLINLIADRALLGAYTLGKRRVSGRVAWRAAGELVSPIGKDKQSRLAGLLSLLLASIALAFYLDAFPDLRGWLMNPLDMGANKNPTERHSAENKPVEHAVTLPPSTPEQPKPTLIELADKAKPPSPAPEFSEWISDAKNQKAIAIRKLLAEWSVTTIGNDAVEPCAQVAESGVRCQSMQSSWVQIKNLNLPAVLEFVLPSGEKRFALVRKVEGDQVEVAFTDRSEKFPANAMLPLWTGNAILAWKPGKAEPKNLMPGERSSLVAWVRQQLGMPGMGEGDTYYDEPLKGKVTEFQKSRGLKADGIIGTLTLLSLQTAGQAAGIPRLTPAAP